MWRRRRDPIVAALFVLVPVSAAAQGLYFEGGLSFARGDYVYTQQTSGGGAAAGLAWSARRLTARVTLPFFVRDTRLLTARGEARPEETDPTSSATGYEGSLSDPLLQVYAQVLQSRRTGVGLSGSAKIPVVEAGYFGTGEWDFGGAASLSQFVGSATMLGVDVSYWHLGDMPDFPLQDTVTGTLTLGQAFGRSWTGSVSVSGGRSSVAGYDNPWWTSLLVGRSFGRGIWGLTASVGLSNAAPDVTVGLVWRARLN
jgi:hypothetical protein